VTRLAAIVLNYRTPDETQRALRALSVSKRFVDDLIVVDNDPTDRGCLTVAESLPGVTYLATTENLGFSGGMNVGIRAALARGAGAVLLVNSDAIVPPDCVAWLERCLDASPDTGIAGPVVRSAADLGRIESLGMSYTPLTGRMRHVSFGARIGVNEILPDRLVDGVSGCVMLVRRAVFESIGLFDEDYFYGFEDLAFCLKARRAGFDAVVAGAATAYHEGGRSIGADSPRRLYFAVRNHLLMAQRTGEPATALLGWCRTLSILMLNVAHAVTSRGGSLRLRLRAVSDGARDYAMGRLGGGRYAS